MGHLLYYVHELGQWCPAPIRRNTMAVYTVRHVVRVIYDEVEADSAEQARDIIRKEIQDTMGVPDQHFVDHETQVFDSDSNVVLG